jgi:hypothetical protein
MDPDPDSGGPITCGSGSGSGFATLLYSFVLQSGFRIRIDLMRIRIRSGSRIFSNCGSGFRIPDPDPGFDDLKLKKITAEKK